MELPEDLAIDEAIVLEVPEVVDLPTLLRLRQPLRLEQRRSEVLGENPKSKCSYVCIQVECGFRLDCLLVELRPAGLQECKVTHQLQSPPGLVLVRLAELW